MIARRHRAARTSPAVAAVLARGAAAAAELAAIPDTDALRQADAALCDSEATAGAEEFAQRLARLARRSADATAGDGAAPAELLAARPATAARRPTGRRRRGAP